MEETRTLRVNGTIEFQVDVEVPVNDIETFDPLYLLDDELTLGSTANIITVESWNVANTQVAW